MSLEKILQLAGTSSMASVPESRAGDLVTAARAAVTEVRAFLAGQDDSSDDDDGEGSNDHSGHPTFRALKRKGVDEDKAKAMCAKADKRVKATAAAEAALVALAGLTGAGGDWVEASAYDHLAAVALTGSAGPAPACADPGFLGKKRLPVDDEVNTRLSAVYLAQPGVRRRYSIAQLATLDAVVGGAMGRFGITATPVDTEKVAGAELLALSVLTAADRKKPSAHTIGDSDDYPIPDKAHLSVAVARYKQGKLAGHSAQEVAAHIRSRARALGETVDLAGSGLDESAGIAALAAKAIGDGGVAMHHAPFTGTHTHTHALSAAHAHPHNHYNDNNHSGGPQHREGSEPSRGMW
jgi:hypothetical protein